MGKMMELFRQGRATDTDAFTEEFEQKQTCKTNIWLKIHVESGMNRDNEEVEGAIIEHSIRRFEGETSPEFRGDES